MSAKASGWWLLASTLAGLLLAGCEKQDLEFDQQLAAQRRQDMAAPTVSGPHGDIAVRGKMSDISHEVQDVLRDAKILIVERGEPGAGKWFLGKSLADRRVLVEITPLLPERSVVRVTVEGGDQLTQELLDHLSKEIARKAR